MRTKILGGIVILAITILLVFNVNLNLNEKDTMSLLSLDNLEALADPEVYVPEGDFYIVVLESFNYVHWTVDGYYYNACYWVYDCYYGGPFECS